MKTLLRLHECDENHTYVVVTIVPLSESSRVGESVGMARKIGARRETLTIMGPMQGLIYVFLPSSAVFLSLTLFFSALVQTIHRSSVYVQLSLHPGLS
jgi:hypothetical protein